MAAHSKFGLKNGEAVAPCQALGAWLAVGGIRRRGAFRQKKSPAVGFFLSGELPNFGRMRQLLSSRVRSFRYAFQGIANFFQTQVNARIHLLAVVLITALGLWLELSAAEWADIILCMALVMVTEAINTALEYLVDLASPDYHPLAGKAKDVAAGAVLLSVLFCAVVWGLIFLPKLWALL